MTTFNRDAADTTNADQLWSGGGLGLDLSGAGYTVGVWDGGHIRATHQEFRVGTGPSRVTIKDSPTSYRDHGTYVGGTIGAEGDQAQARGMANQVELWSYDWTNDMTEMAAAAGSIVASNHSYGYVRGWTRINVEGTWYGQWVDDRCLGNQDRFFGKYDSNTRTLDTTLFNHPNLLSVWAAGNDRGENLAGLNSQYVTYLGSSCAPSGAGLYFVPTNHPTWPAPGADGSHKGGYDILAQQQTAKNSLVVGAIDDITVDPYAKSDVVMTSFSAWGPR